jgi:hypothetical protein
MLYVLDDNGEPVQTDDVRLFGEFFADFDRRLMARDEIEGVTVSTVFLGVDHGYGHSERPLLFETMIFGGPDDGDMWRYESRQAALDGHRFVVEQVRKGADR